MKDFVEFKPFYSHDTDVYNLKDFSPSIVDKAYLDNLGVKVEPSESTLEGLTRGSKVFMERVKNKTVIPVSKLYLENIDPEKVNTEIHNYTGRCPTLTFEINPIKISKAILFYFFHINNIRKGRACQKNTIIFYSVSAISKDSINAIYSAITKRNIYIFTKQIINIKINNPAVFRMKIYPSIFNI